MAMLTVNMRTQEGDTEMAPTTNQVIFLDVTNTELAGGATARDVIASLSITTGAQWDFGDQTKGFAILPNDRAFGDIIPQDTVTREFGVYTNNAPTDTYTIDVDLDYRLDTPQQPNIVQKAFTVKSEKGGVGIG